MDEQRPLLSAEYKMALHDAEVAGNVTQSTIPPFTRALQVNNGKSTLTQLPQTIAHRGYKAKHPENTMGAFKGAVEIGAHALETDLHLSKDGIIVLSHDATLKRCFGLEDKIIDCDWSFLETLYTLKEPKEKMPRLKDLLEYLTTPGLDDIWVLLDIKLDNDADDIMRTIALTIKEVNPSSRPWNQRIVLGCWAAKYVPLCETYLPTYPITHIGFHLTYARKFLALPHEPPISFNIFQKILVGPCGSWFRRDLKKAGRTLLVWTVNERVWMKWSIRKEVDGVITDDPKLFLEICDEVREGKGGDGVRIRDYLMVIVFNLAAVVFGALFRWRFPFGEVGKKEKRKVAI